MPLKESRTGEKKGVTEESKRRQPEQDEGSTGAADGGAAALGGAVSGSAHLMREEALARELFERQNTENTNLAAPGFPLDPAVPSARNGVSLSDARYKHEGPDGDNNGDDGGACVTSERDTVISQFDPESFAWKGGRPFTTRLCDIVFSQLDAYYTRDKWLGLESAALAATVKEETTKLFHQFGPRKGAALYNYTETTQFRNSKAQFGYLLKQQFARTLLLLQLCHKHAERLMMIFRSALRERGLVRVGLVGGGCIPEALALAECCRTTNIDLSKMSFTVFDYAPEWRTACEAVSLNVQFVDFDIRKPSQEQKLMLARFDLVTCSFMLWEQLRGSSLGIPSPHKDALVNFLADQFSYNKPWWIFDILFPAAMREIESALDAALQNSSASKLKKSGPSAWGAFTATAAQKGFVSEERKIKVMELQRAVRETFKPRLAQACEWEALTSPKSEFKIPIDEKPKVFEWWVCPEEDSSESS